jgi:ABC-2 type transport system ATP-binding protein
MIEIDHLSKYFGTLKAVDDINFQVSPGEVLGFLGPNGAGKSTTMKVITGFLAPTSGRVRVSGHDVVSEPIAVKSRIGYLPEGAPLYPDMTPASFLGFIAEVRGLKGARREERIREVVQRVHIDGVMDQQIETLSKGFKRRVGLAQAILHDPEVLILDEPTDGLDPNQKHEVRSLIKEMAHDKVIVLSTHILEEVEAVCTRAIIIARGKLLFDGTPSELRSRSPRHNAVSVTFHGTPPADAVKALSSLSSVQRVEVTSSDGEPSAYRLYPRNGASIVGEIGQFAVQRGWELDELHVERGYMDEVFRIITEGETALS